MKCPLLPLSAFHLLALAPGARARRFSLYSWEGRGIDAALAPPLRPPASRGALTSALRRRAQALRDHTTRSQCRRRRNQKFINDPLRVGAGRPDLSSLRLLGSASALGSSCLFCLSAGHGALDRDLHARLRAQHGAGGAPECVPAPTSSLPCRRTPATPPRRLGQAARPARGNRSSLMDVDCPPSVRRPRDRVDEGQRLWNGRARL